MDDAGDLPTRVERLQSALLEVFSDNLEGSLEVSPRSDALDAIATGINVLIEELRQERFGAEVRSNRHLDELLSKLRTTQDQLVHSQKM
jgi:hypothetical protein